jgi:hypothetical protein
MMNPKWITEIDLVDKTYEIFWAEKGLEQQKRTITFIPVYYAIIRPNSTL